MKKVFLFGFALSAIAILSCKKTDNFTVDPAGPYTTMSTTFSNLAVKTQTVTIDASKGGSVIGPNGARFIFSPSAFRTGAGAVVSGNVEIEFADYHKKGDMIFSSMLPISDNEPLISGGEFYINAKQNGQRLSANGYFQVNMPQFGKTEPGMEFFVGLKDQGTNPNVNWKKAKVDSFHKPVGSLVYKGDTISVFSDSTGYCNADNFMKNPNYKNFKVNIEGIILESGDAVNAYAMYDNYNAVWKMSSITANTISEGHVPNIPVHFVVMTIKNGYFYAGTVAATPAEGGTYTVTLSKTDPLSFKATLNGM